MRQAISRIPAILLTAGTLAGLAESPVAASSATGEALDAVRSYRDANGAGILGSFAELIAIPNVATDSDNNQSAVPWAVRKRAALCY